MGFARKTNDLSYLRGWEVSLDGLVYMVSDLDKMTDFCDMLQRMLSMGDLPLGLQRQIETLREEMLSIRGTLAVVRNQRRIVSRNKRESIVN